LRGFFHAPMAGLAKSRRYKVWERGAASFRAGDTVGYWSERPQGGLANTVCAATGSHVNRAGYHLVCRSKDRVHTGIARRRSGLRNTERRYGRNDSTGKWYLPRGVN
jgi:hypothetical protein